MSDYTPLRVEIKPANREKLENATNALNASAQVKISPNELVNRLVESLEEFEIVQTLTVKLRASDGSQKVIRKVRTVGTFRQ